MKAISSLVQLMRLLQLPQARKRIPGRVTFHSGFSLVEVTLALGIVAFGLIAIFGLLPSGLNLVRESAEEATAVNIMGSIASRLQAGKNLPSGTTPIERYYYDGEGLELPSASSGEAEYLAVIGLQVTSLPRMATIRVFSPANNSSRSVETIIVLKEPRN